MLHALSQTIITSWSLLEWLQNLHGYIRQSRNFTNFMPQYCFNCCTFHASNSQSFSLCYVTKGNRARYNVCWVEHVFIVTYVYIYLYIHIHTFPHTQCVDLFIEAKLGLSYSRKQSFYTDITIWYLYRKYLDLSLGLKMLTYNCFILIYLKFYFN